MPLLALRLLPRRHRLHLSLLQALPTPHLSHQEHALFPLRLLPRHLHAYGRKPLHRPPLRRRHLQGGQPRPQGWSHPQPRYQLEPLFRLPRLGGHRELRPPFDQRHRLLPRGSQRNRPLSRTPHLLQHPLQRRQQLPGRCRRQPHLPPRGVAQHPPLCQPLPLGLRGRPPQGGTLQQCHDLLQPPPQLLGQHRRACAPQPLGQLRLAHTSPLRRASERLHH